VAQVARRSWRSAGLRIQWQSRKDAFSNIYAVGPALAGKSWNRRYLAVTLAVTYLTAGRSTY